MGLMEFLRQWQPSRLTAGIVVSVLLHAALIAALLGGHLPRSKYDVKRGEPLIVELPRGDDSPPPGTGGTPAPAAPPSVPAPPAAPAIPPAPHVTPTPPAPRAVAKPTPRPSEPTRAERRPAEPAPRPEPERRVASATPPKAPDGTAPDTPTPSKPDTPQPAERSPADRAAADAAASAQGQRQVASLPRPSQPAGPDILTALRRGAGGGAGGHGQGREGIEGEPIPLDSADPKYSDYLDQVRRRIKDKWGFPCVKNDATRQCEYKTTTLVIEFGIAKDGKVPFVNVVRSSGYPIYDDYAVNAVKLASPFPPIPDAFSKKGVPILATFSYVVESSLANILR